MKTVEHIALEREVIQVKREIVVLKAMVETMCFALTYGAPKDFYDRIHKTLSASLEQATKRNESTAQSHL